MILVTGASGNLGSSLVPLLVDAGADVHALSRQPRPAADGVTWHQGDLRTGDGLEALKGADTIVHCASDWRRPKADLPATKNLLEAAKNKPHIVYISIVGVDDHPYGYYKTKYAVERLIADSGLPHTILRTTQFFELLDMVLGLLAKSPLVMPILSKTSDQPLDVDEVAAHMAELALAEPAGRVPDMGGPEVLTFNEIARAYLKATGRRRTLISLHLPGSVGRAFREGRHLAPGHPTAKRTWSDYLAARYPH
ncbi:SDR family oxidoreductase [Actinomadura barringtoniae]|uniref:SDR family oxidoreductase n=1 Tax=Actinomadura barringtoniae TaxID=1427535 RepID=A0A939PHQ9_9ACTN|nr:SDR family oxidoreductase [Actinomadura barringtoniae]MBO2452675.1 SDR family oxidoreductase [Actinomadura barringtoniae]